ncbi:flagellar hook-associated protein FlgK [Serratia ureilytica]
MSGLNAAQVALSTVSNNISNYNVAGYNRQTAILAQNGGMATMSGFIGNGVTVTSVNREYNQFITNQLRGTEFVWGAKRLLREDFADRQPVGEQTNPLSTNMQDFFTNLQNLVSNAGDDAARQTVLGKANGLVNQFNNTDKFLRDMDSGVNQQISDTAQQINSYSQQIAKLNDEITRLRGSAGGEPNALLDQRDQLVTELNQLVGVQVTQQDGDAYTVSFANGLTWYRAATPIRWKPCLPAAILPV